MTDEQERAQMMTERDAAAALGVSVASLRRWRYEGRGPVVHRYPTGTVRYARADVAAFRSAARR